MSGRCCDFWQRGKSPMQSDPYRELAEVAEAMPRAPLTWKRVRRPIAETIVATCMLCVCEGIVAGLAGVLRLVITAVGFWWIFGAVHGVFVVIALIWWAFEVVGEGK